MKVVPPQPKFDCSKPTDIRNNAGGFFSCFPQEGLQLFPPFGKNVVWSKCLTRLTVSWTCVMCLVLHLKTCPPKHRTNQGKTGGVWPQTAPTHTGATPRTVTPHPPRCALNWHNSWQWMTWSPVVHKRKFWGISYTNYHRTWDFKCLLAIGHNLTRQNYPRNNQTYF